MIYIEYLVLAILVVYLSVRLSYYVDCLDKKTNLSGAFIGESCWLQSPHCLNYSPH